MTKKIKDGPFKKYFDDGKYLYEGKFKNNKRIGTFTVTNTITDVVEEIYNYKNNKLHGPYKKYNSFGKIREDGNYKDDKPHGQWKYYVRDDLTGGSRILEECVYKNGQRDGPRKLYWDDYSGNLHSEGYFKGLKYEGPCKFYFQTGELYTEGTIKNGKSHGHLKRYHKNGRVSDEGNMKNGKLDGVWKFYDENGQLVREGTFKDNELIDSKEY